MLFSKEMVINDRVLSFNFNKLLNVQGDCFFVIVRYRDVTNNFFKIAKERSRWIILDDDVPEWIRNLEGELSDAINAEVSG